MENRMKTGYCLGGLALGLIVGAGVGYLIASDPRKKAKIDGFFEDVSDKVNDLGEKVSEKVSDLSEKVTELGDQVKAAIGLDHCDNLSEEEIIAIETALASESPIADTEGKKSPKGKK